MDLTKISLVTLKQITTLLEQKEALAAQIATIDKEINALDGEAPTAPAPAEPVIPAKSTRKARRKVVKTAAAPVKAITPVVKAAAPAAPKVQAKAGRKPGHLAAGIQDLLKKAGKSGLSVKRIANILGTKRGNIAVWFSVHKKVKQIKKIGVGQYAWVG